MRIGKTRADGAETTAENGRVNGNGNFIDKIVVAVRTKRFVIVTDRSRRETRFLDSTLISLAVETTIHSQNFRFAED